MSFKPIARRITVILRGPGRVHMRQTRQESTIGPISLIASSGAPACRSSSDNRMLGACQNRTCNLLRVRLMTAGSRECSSLRACPRSNAVHSCVSVSSPVSVGPGIRSDLCLSLFAIALSLVCSSAVFRGAGRRAVDDELRLVVVGSAAGSASGSSGSGALGAIFPTSSLDSATLGTRSMSLAGSRVMSTRDCISGTLHSFTVRVCPGAARPLPSKHAGHFMSMDTSSGNLHSTGTLV